MRIFGIFPYSVNDHAGYNPISFSLLTYKKNRQPGILPNVRYLLVIISKLICQLTIAHSDIHQTAAFENTLRSENTKNQNTQMVPWSL